MKQLVWEPNEADCTIRPLKKWDSYILPTRPKPLLHKRQRTKMFYRISRRPTSLDPAMQLRHGTNAQSSWDTCQTKSNELIFVVASKNWSDLQRTKTSKTSNESTKRKLFASFNKFYFFSEILVQDIFAFCVLVIFVLLKQKKNGS